MAALRIADFPAERVADHADTIHAICGGHLDVALIRNVLAAPIPDSALSALEAGGARFAGRPVFPPGSPYHAVRMLGTMLAPTELCPSGPKLSDYKADAASFEATCHELFGAPPGFIERIAAVLSALFFGRPANVPRFPDDATFTAATLRIMPIGGGAACAPRQHARHAHLRAAAHPL